jgi:hypothetical protein
MTDQDAKLIFQESYRRMIEGLCERYGAIEVIFKSDGRRVIVFDVETKPSAAEQAYVERVLLATAS